MSLRGGRQADEAIPRLEEIASGKEQERPRNDRVIGFLFRVGKDCSVEACGGQERGVRKSFA